MKRGDHIKVRRFVYSHHGIFLGNNRVIHYCGEPLKKWGAQIVRTTLREFQGDAPRSAIRVVEYEPTDVLPVDEVIERAEARLREKKYNLIFSNCEHFAAWCKADQHTSPQVKIGEIACVGGLLGLLALVGGPSGAINIVGGPAATAVISFLRFGLTLASTNQTYETLADVRLIANRQRELLDRFDLGISELRQGQEWLLREMRSGLEEVVEARREDWLRQHLHSYQTAYQKVCLEIEHAETNAVRLDDAKRLEDAAHALHSWIWTRLDDSALSAQQRCELLLMGASARRDGIDAMLMQSSDNRLKRAADELRWIRSDMRKQLTVLHETTSIWQLVRLANRHLPLLAVLYRNLGVIADTLEDADADVAGSVDQAFSVVEPLWEQRAPTTVGDLIFLETDEECVWFERTFAHVEFPFSRGGIRAVPRRVLEVMVGVNDPSVSNQVLMHLADPEFLEVYEALMLHIFGIDVDVALASVDPALFTPCRVPEIAHHQVALRGRVRSQATSTLTLGTHPGKYLLWFNIGEREVSLSLTFHKPKSLVFASFEGESGWSPRIHGSFEGSLLILPLDQECGDWSFSATTGGGNDQRFLDRIFARPLPRRLGEMLFGDQQDDPTANPSTPPESVTSTAVAAGDGQPESGSAPSRLVFKSGRPYLSVESSDGSKWPIFFTALELVEPY